ncbi:MAG: hypothetical protein AB7V48_01870 [Sedimentibacter sp.]
MSIDTNIEKAKITPILLHLELRTEYLSDYQKRMLRRYGESSTGESITRDILIPSDMPLHNLHYAIQKLYGWQNSHLRCFYLPEEIYYKLTSGTVKGWSDLVGVLFQPPSESEHDVFWDDDYRSGSINAWLKKKYTGPYFYGGDLEHLEAAKTDMHELLERFKMFDVRESFSDYMKRKNKGEDTELKILRRAPLIELTLEEMNSSLYIEGGTESLLERLEVDKVIASDSEKIGSNGLFPVTNKLLYNYDFGDNWIITITKKADCNNLLTSNIISHEELDEANENVLIKHKPVCINKDGISLIDDVGGLSGFADFLGTIYESEDKEERTNASTWARSLGFNTKKISNKMML